MTHALTHFLNPQSVAIIGVSPNPSFSQRYPQQFAPLAVRQAYLPGEPELSRHRRLADLPTH